MKYQAQEDIPQWKQSKKNLRTYVIVDCAQLKPENYQHFTRHKQLKCCSLFANTIHQEAVSAAPLLIAYASLKETELLTNLLEIQRKYPAVVWFSSEQNFDQVTNCLQDLLFAVLPDGKEVLCRYYDPRNLAVFLEIFRQNLQTKPSVSVIEQWAIWSANLQNIEYIK